MRDPSSERLTVIIAREAYHAYGATTDHKNFQGNPMPAWADLPEKIQLAWMNAVKRASAVAAEIITAS